MPTAKFCAKQIFSEKTTTATITTKWITILVYATDFS